MTWLPPEELSMQAIESDTWDRREHQRATKGMRAYGRARNSLFKVTKTGPDALVDVFMVLYKASPRMRTPAEMQPTHLLNHTVAFELLTLAATRRLRTHTVGDSVQAVLGCIELAPTLEAIFERLKMERELAEKLAAKIAELLRIEGVIAEIESDIDGMSDDDMAAALDAARLLRANREYRNKLDAELQDMMDTLSECLSAEAGQLRDELRDAITSMADEADSLATSAMAWGLSLGKLHQLPAKERLALAKRLKSDRMRKIADLFGRIQNLSFADLATTLDATHDEIVDLELGGDLSRVAPSELLLLGDQDLELDFFARLADRELLQYSVQGSDELGRGGIVMCVDGSGSMTGQPELWAKAVMLVLLHEARAQRRSMHVILFGAPREYKQIGFNTPASYTAERIMEAAGAFYGGGTDFQTPMEVALQELVAEHDRTGVTRADVVFATDDECWVDGDFMEHYLSEMKRIGARTYGLALRHAPNPQGPLARMSEGRVITVHDLQSGREIRDLLRAVKR